MGKREGGKREEAKDEDEEDGDPFSLLPTEHLFNDNVKVALLILELLDVRSLCSACGVCRRWKSLAEDDTTWNSLLRKLRKFASVDPARPWIGRTSAYFEHPYSERKTAKKCFTMAFDDMTTCEWGAGNEPPRFTKYIGHTAKVRCVSYGSDSDHFVSVAGGSVRLWSREYNELIVEKFVKTLTIRGCALSPSLSYAALGKGSYVVLVDLASDEEDAHVTLGASTQRFFVWSVCYLGNERDLASSTSDGTLTLWDSESHGAVSTWTLPGRGDLHSVDWSSANGGHLLASAGFTRVVHMVDRRVADKPVMRMVGHSAPVSCVRFAPNGVGLVTSSEDMSLRLYDVRKGAERQTLGVFKTGDPLSCVTWNGDGSLLFAGGYARIYRWNTSTGQQLQTLKEHTTQPVSSLSTSPDGRFMCSGSWDSIVCTWELAQKGTQTRSNLRITSAV